MVESDVGMERIARSLPLAAGHAGSAAESRTMSSPQALAALAAMGQSTRLEIFRLLMRHEPGGMPAGLIAEMLGCPQNTLSSHISILARAGLVTGTREGRSINYRANVEGMRALLGFLVTNCCDGHPELCGFVGGMETGGGCSPGDVAGGQADFPSAEPRGCRKD